VLHGSLSVARDINAAPARVWDAYANADLRSAWRRLPGPDGVLELDFRVGTGFDFTVAAAFTANLVAELERTPLPEGTLLNINVPGARPSGVSVARLGKRIYRDELSLIDEDSTHPRGRRQYRIYGDASFERDETGTDLAAVAAGRIAVTPIHFDLTDRDGLDALERYDLARLVAPAAEEVGEPMTPATDEGPDR